MKIFDFHLLFAQKNFKTETKLIFVLNKMSWICFWSQIQMDIYVQEPSHLVLNVMDKKKMTWHWISSLHLLDVQLWKIIIIKKTGSPRLFTIVLFDSVARSLRDNHCQSHAHLHHDMLSFKKTFLSRYDKNMTKK